MTVKKELFGRIGDDPVEMYTLSEGALSVSVLTYGGIIRSLRYRGKETVLGFPTLDGYLQSKCYYGATVGRCCNRMKTLSITSAPCPIIRNENGITHLHGGVRGLDKKIWDATVDGNTLSLSTFSADGEEGYPGNLSVKVHFTLEKDTLCISYEALSDRDTAVNLTHHDYFNLNGGGTVLEHTACIRALECSVCDSDHVPTGAHMSVVGTPPDFSTPKPIGRDIETFHPQTTPWGGYDNNYMLFPVSAGTPNAVFCGSDIRMDVFTDAPCLQFYTSNDTHPEPMDGWDSQPKYRAFCVETQREPNGCMHSYDILKKEQCFHTYTKFRFSLIKGE